MTPIDLKHKDFGFSVIHLWRKFDLPTSLEDAWSSVYSGHFRVWVRLEQILLQ